MLRNGDKILTKRFVVAKIEEKVILLQEQYSNKEKYTRLLSL